MIGDHICFQPSAATVSAYEALREQCLSSSLVHGGSGLRVLLRDGMLAWARDGATRTDPVRTAATATVTPDQHSLSSAAAHPSLVDAMVAMLSGVSRSRPKGAPSA